MADLAFRERRRVTLQEIAEITGLNRMTISKLVNQHGANVQTDVVDKLCNYFGCRVEELMEHIPDNIKE
jgi:DNA-binding Xre family transcriptional regulator